MVQRIVAVLLLVATISVSADMLITISGGTNVCMQQEKGQILKVSECSQTLITEFLVEGEHVCGRCNVGSCELAFFIMPYPKNDGVLNIGFSVYPSDTPVAPGDRRHRSQTVSWGEPITFRCSKTGATVHVTVEKR